jgi:putative transposase
MSTRRRIFCPDLSVHVIHRGNNRLPVFSTDTECEVFLALLRFLSQREAVDVHAFVLMSTHHHMIVTPGHATALPNMMRDLGAQFGRYFNRAHGRIGTVWNGRYRGITIADDKYWLTCLRYIELNPVRAHIVDTPEDYRWSSYRAHALGETIEWLVPHPTYLALGTCSEHRQNVYRSLCSVALTPGELARQRLGVCERPPRRQLLVSEPLAVG